MNVLVNVFHPDLASSSVNTAWVEALKQSNDVTLNLAYANYPNWQFDVTREQKLMAEHDFVVFQFPFFWYSVPPLMKKWLDDVLTYGWAYGTEGEALKGKRASLAISTGCTQESYQSSGDNKYSIDELLRPVQQTLDMTQMDYKAPFVFHGAATANKDDIAQSTTRYLARIAAERK
jgi:putative NADPH-quinone reductase